MEKKVISKKSLILAIFCFAFWFIGSLIIAFKAPIPSFEFVIGIVASILPVYWGIYLIRIAKKQKKESEDESA